jgi:DNA-binding transcriptional regulator YiaG
MTGRTKFPRPYVALRQPGQRRRDHGARRREAEWRAYQAAWQKPIDEMRCSPEAFFHLRRNVLVLNRKQCARLLRVSVGAVFFWETGRHPVPFPAFLALQLVSESTHYRLANYAWRDWQFIERLPEDSFAIRRGRRDNEITEIVNRKTGAHFTPDELDHYFAITQQAIALQSEAEALHRKVGTLTRENTEIREMFRTDGVTAELLALRERMNALVSKINTAEVVSLPKGGKALRTA